MNEVNLDILTRPFPKEAVMSRKVGNNYLWYVPGHAIIRRLNESSGNQWSFKVLDINQMGDIMTATVELTLPGLGSRQHIGVQRMINNGGEDLVKGAITDGLKKAATLFGVALELYGEDVEHTPAQSAQTSQSQSRQFSGNGNGRRENMAASASTQSTRRIGFRHAQQD